MKRIISVIVMLATASIILMLVNMSARAETIDYYSDTKPVDLVIVMDKSGSMKSSDPRRMTCAAVNMLVNMMPVEGSRVGIIAFNNEPEVLTTVGGAPALLPLKDIGNVDDIRTGVSQVQYHGATGIGNALGCAADLLSEKSDDDHKKVILLFTDGLNDFGDDEEALAACEENEANAVLWAKQNSCPIYCYGYDYTTDSGASSMGANGEGLRKLENIASISGGKAARIYDINTVEDEFIKMVADVFDLIYIPVGVVPADGNKHEIPVEVNPSVIEANIRVGSSAEDAVKNGSISVTDPSGNNYELKNDESSRYNIDSLAASIKVIRPDSGNWTITVDGISGDDIKIGLLQHYRIDIGASLELPEGNPPGVAFMNDEIKVRAWLNEDDTKITDKLLYDTITNAIVTYYPNAHPDNVRTLDLTRDQDQFTGSFLIDEECIYNVKVRLESGAFYREADLNIESTNHPLELISDIDNVVVSKGELTKVENLYSHVRDVEGDPITATITMIGDPDTASVYIIDDEMSVEGKAWKSTYATVTFRDAQGNTVESSFKITVYSKAVIIGSGVLTLLIILGVVLLALGAYHASLSVKGYITILELCKIDLNDEYGEQECLYHLDDDLFVDDGLTEDYTRFKCSFNTYGLFSRDKNLYPIARKFCEDYEHFLEDNDRSITDPRDNPISDCMKTYFNGLKDFGVTGTPGGLNGFVIRLPKKISKIYMEAFKNKKGKVRISSWPKQLVFIAPVSDYDEDKHYAYRFKFVYSKTQNN